MTNISKDVLHSVSVECIKSCCSKQHAIIASCLAVLSFIFFMLQDVASVFLLVVWIVIGVLIIAVRFTYTVWFSKLTNVQVRPLQAKIFTSIMLCWGTHLGIGTVIFFPMLTVLEQASWFAMFMAMVASSSSSHAVYLPAFYAFSFPYFLGMWWACVVEFPSDYHINAIIFTFIMLSQASSTHKANRTARESFRLRFENVELIENLRLEKESAERANNAKSKFLAAASHDLRQPLHALSLFSSALQDALGNRNKSAALVVQINDSVDALQSLFNALLDISRLDAGTLACEKIHFISDTLMLKLKNEFEPLASQKDLVIQWDFQPTALYSDPTLLELILRNLISNAIRYTHRGEIVVKLERARGHVILSVLDTGIGIPSDKHEQVFEEFTQLHNPERDRNKGLGLGLSIVKRVANLMQSKLCLNSIEGEGSRFSIHVTLGDIHKIDLNKESTFAEQNQESANILVVDDELAIQQAMQSLLEGWGYRVFAVANIQQAIKVIEGQNLIPDAIVADYRLRKYENGVDLVETLRQKYRADIPALIVSGDIAIDKLKQVQASGLEMLHKPIKPARLRAFLKNKIA